MCVFSCSWLPVTSCAFVLKRLSFCVPSINSYRRFCHLISSSSLVWVSFQFMYSWNRGFVKCSWNGVCFSFISIVTFGNIIVFLINIGCRDRIFLTRFRDWPYLCNVFGFVCWTSSCLGIYTRFWIWLLRLPAKWEETKVSIVSHCIGCAIDSIVSINCTIDSSKLMDLWRRWWWWTYLSHVVLMVSIVVLPALAIKMFV